LDDSFGSRIVADTKANKISYGTEPSANFRLADVSFDLNGTNFTITHNDRTYKASTSLVGDFNAHNSCAAFTAASSLGIDAEIIVEGIKNTKAVPGRFEVIGDENKKVIVDYSHTPDSLKKALLAIRKIVKDEKPVYAVFGCGGNRDKTKRPIMGKIASEFADRVIITSDNPRFEEPLSIINEIESGIIKENYTVIENREDAIKNAINSSEENAVILIAGKGHETYQDIKGNKIHFSDKEIAEKYLLR
jgi:UDP-N-acetylmuramoyl-L-alanyl-D-glutamate--2,6-diaminopimelate ligase